MKSSAVPPESSPDTDARLVDGPGTATSHGYGEGRPIEVEARPASCPTDDTPNLTIRRPTWLPLLLLGGTIFLVGSSVQAQEAGDAPPSGRDITRPLQRIDLRVEHADEGDENSTTFTLRHDRPVELGDGWRANLRMDLPFKRVEDAGEDASFGPGEMLVQAIFVREIGAQGFGFGTQVIIPTASGNALGRGQWRLRPTAGYRWSTPSISKGSYFQAVARYDFSIASEHGRGETRELQFSPNLEIELPGEAYFSVFPSTDIRYNFSTDEFFLPANVEVGKQWGRAIMSLEGGAAVISGDGAPYKWKLEARVGYRF